MFFANTPPPQEPPLKIQEWKHLWLYIWCPSMKWWSVLPSPRPGPWKNFWLWNKLSIVQQSLVVGPGFLERESQGQIWPQIQQTITIMFSVVAMAIKTPERGPSTPVFSTLNLLLVPVPEFEQDKLEKLSSCQFQFIFSFTAPYPYFIIIVASNSSCNNNFQWRYKVSAIAGTRASFQSFLGAHISN